MAMIFGITSGDMVFIILLGLSLIALLATGSMIRGLISGMVGLLISFIGFQVTTGIPRFDFGTLYLYDRLPLIAVLMGMFAMPEAISLAMGGSTIVQTTTRVAVRVRDTFEGIIDILRHLRIFLTSTVIGYIIGIIPGVGSMVATFICYGHAKETSKHPEEFGTGRVEGVIAPEAANNSKEAGALLTTLALGIPGGTSMVILLAAFILLGLEPGPAMLTEQLPLSFTLLIAIAVANLIGAVICILTAAQAAKVALVPARILFPLIIIFSAIAAFVYQGQVIDLAVLVIFTALGLTMRRFGYNRPSLLLGFVLGYKFEQYFFLALHTAGPLFFLTPVSLALIFTIILLLSYKSLSRVVRRLLEKGEKEA